MAGGRIDVHFHMIPQFYADKVYAAGSGPAAGGDVRATTTAAGRVTPGPEGLSRRSSDSGA